MISLLNTLAKLCARKGGYRRGGYEAHIMTKLFREGVKDLREFARRKRVYIMRMEKNSSRSHCHFLIAYLKRNSLEVIHVLEENQRRFAKFKKYNRKQCIVP